MNIINTKDDAGVVIRQGTIQDAASVLAIQRDTILENDYLISVPEEFDKTIQQQCEWIQKVLDNARETIIVAEKDTEVVGFIVFQSPDRKRLSHTGAFGMMLNKDYRGLGIGRVLIKELLMWAENNPLIEKVGLGVLSTNLRARSLYTSLGFKEEGRKVNEIKLGKGRYADDILMYKFV